MKTIPHFTGYFPYRLRHRFQRSRCLRCTDSTYPQLTYDTWNNLNYALPWCWVATEVMDKTGYSTLLRLDQGEGELSLKSP